MAKKPPPRTREMVDQAVLWLVSGLGTEQTITMLVSKLRMPAPVASAIVTDACALIKSAATFDREEQVGMAVSRMTDIYTRALLAKDRKSAISAQKEINALMGLYPMGDGDPGDDDEPGGAPEVGLALAHLRPLRLAGPKVPLAELCRLAAARIMELESTT